MRIGILKTDEVRPEFVAKFGEYPDMFAALLGAVDASLEFVTFFFNYSATTQIYPPSLHGALSIFRGKYLLEIR